jgi:hypothetical protein
MTGRDTKFYSEDLKEREYLEDTGIDDTSLNFRLGGRNSAARTWGNFIYGRLIYPETDKSL